MKNSDMLDLVEKLPFYYDEPFGDSSNDDSIKACSTKCNSSIE
nr:hypothetical protein [Aliarcobacter butzleri]